MDQNIIMWHVTERERGISHGCIIDSWAAMFCFKELLSNNNFLQKPLRSSLCEHCNELKSLEIHHLLLMTKAINTQSCKFTLPRSAEDEASCWAIGPSASILSY